MAAADENGHNATGNQLRRSWQPTFGLAISIGAFLALLAWLVPWAQEQCTSWQGAALTAGCAEYWIHRYQNLIAGLVALLAALLVVRELRSYAEAGQNDQAERLLTGLADALVDIMKAHDAILTSAPGSNEQELSRNLAAATDRAEIKSGLISSLMGQDAAVLAHYVNHCRFSATHRTSSSANPKAQSQMVWSLFSELINSINQRKAELRNGAPISALYEMALIDRTNTILEDVKSTSPA